MDKLVSPNQSGILKGKMLVDDVVAINEVIDLAKRTKQVCLSFKVDFDKTYDSVSWNFLDYMLIIFDFNDKRRSWIKTCIFSSYLVVLVNDSLTLEIKIKECWSREIF